MLGSMLFVMIASGQHFHFYGTKINWYQFYGQVKRLLDEGMDVNVITWGSKLKGVTPLHLAAEGGHLEVMDELLERGANIDARTKGACGCKLLQYLPFILWVMLWIPNLSFS